MEQVSTICGFLCILCLFVAPIALIIWIVLNIKKSPKKKSAKHFCLGAIAGVVVFTVIGVVTSPTTRCEHEWKTIEQTAPTCTENGTSIAQCALCNTKRNAEEIPPLDHAWVENRKEATCELDGASSHKCKLCNLEETEIIPATGHSFVEKTVQEASCASTGITEKICTACNKTERITTEKTPHTYEVTSITEATLESSGIEEFSCSVCGDIKQKELTKLGTKENPGKVTIEQLVSEINANIDAAKAKYNGQWIEITGKVLDADNVAGMTRFCIYENTGVDNFRIVCWINEEVLKPFDYQGDTVVFLGQMREITTFNATEIGDCQIISE